jgi:N-acetylmuramoyl-L-alanine amidase
MYWQDIYNHGENADFRARRPNPNVLFAGDVLYIPDPPENAREHSAATDKQHQFRVRVPKVLVRLRVLDEAGEPFASRHYRLVVQGTEHRGVTDGDGTLEAFIAASASRGALTVWETHENGAHLAWQLDLGHLDPITTVAGVQARLNNLGYLCGEVDGRLGRKTRGAITGFQHAEHLSMTGRADEATRARLLERHDGR